jgi:excisionase family DNA binding protein
VRETRKSYRDNIADNLGGCDPFLVPVKQASAVIGKSPRSIYELMAAGELKAVKSGRNTLIVYDSIRKYVAGLPQANIKPYVRAAK